MTKHYGKVFTAHRKRSATSSGLLSVLQVLPSLSFTAITITQYDNSLKRWTMGLVGLVVLFHISVTCSDDVLKMLLGFWVLESGKGRGFGLWLSSPSSSLQLQPPISNLQASLFIIFIVCPRDARFES